MRKHNFRPARRIPSVAIVSLSVLLLSTHLGCGSDSSHEEEGHDDEETLGEPTGSTCPDDSSLTYETFGREFMDAYCTRCHSSELEGEARNGAPDDHNFDSLGGIRATEAEHLDKQAAAGPDASNGFMPPDGTNLPPEEERVKLGEWVACGMP